MFVQFVHWVSFLVEGNHALHADLGVASIACKTNILSVVALLETLCMQQPHIYVDVYTYTHIHVSMHIMYVCNECMYACIYVCIYLCIYMW